MPIRHSTACRTLELTLDTTALFFCCKLIFVQCLLFCHSSCQECSLKKKCRCWIYHDRILTLPIILSLYLCGGFSDGSMVKNPPSVQETRVLSLGWENPPEKEMATPSIVLAWGIPWTEEPGRLQSMGSQKGQIWLSDWTTAIYVVFWCWVLLCFPWVFQIICGT